MICESKEDPISILQNPQQREVRVTGTLKLCLLGNFACFFVICCFFQNQLFGKIISEIPSECQTGWIQIRLNKMLGLICVQAVCKGYQQMTLVGRVKNNY